MDVIIRSLIAACFVFVFFYLSVFMVTVMGAELECLEKGYPEYRVVYNLNSYCMNLEGTVTVNVDKL